MQIASVKYQIATYSGTVDVRCNEDDEHEAVIAKAKQRLEREFGPLPFGSQSFEILERN